MENTTQAPTSDTQGSADRSPITLTDKALQMVKITREQEGIEADYGLRVAVRGGGCSGMEYALDFEREPRDNDFVISYEGLEVYVDGISARYLQGTEIDYILGSTGAGFKFNNPNATGSCGCGSSFSV
jgi:iron-sulfur cluster assembly accessory protein